MPPRASVRPRRELSRRGHGVTLVPRRASRLETLACRSPRHRCARTSRCRRPSDRDARAALVASRWPNSGSPRRHLVNNAGSDDGTGGKIVSRGRYGPVAVDVGRGSPIGASVFLPAMVEAGSGRRPQWSPHWRFPPLPGPMRRRRGQGLSVLPIPNALAVTPRPGVQVSVLCPPALSRPGS